MAYKTAFGSLLNVVRIWCTLNLLLLAILEVLDTFMSGCKKKEITKLPRMDNEASSGTETARKKNKCRKYDNVFWIHKY
jgi:hypothetical protein